MQTHIRDTSEALRELGHEVTIVTPKIHDEAPDQDGDVRRVGRAVRTRFAATAFEMSIALGPEARRLQDLMQTFDIVHCHAIWTPVLPLQAMVVSGAPSVATVHDTPPDTPAGAFARCVMPHVSRWMLPWYDQVVTVSASSRRRLRAGPGQNIAIIPPCTDLRRFAAASARPRVEGGAVKLLFLGRLEPRKGCAVLLEAYRRLRAEGLHVRLEIVGGGAEEAALRQTVAERAIPDVCFLGPLPDEAALRRMADCDIFCAPSLYGESFGIVIAEAMAAGKPVVAAANPGYSTVLAGERAGRLTSPGDAGALQAGLRELILDPDLRRRLGESGRAEAAQYDCRAIAPRLVAIYREAILVRHARSRRRPLRGLIATADEPAGI